MASKSSSLPPVKTFDAERKARISSAEQFADFAEVPA